MLPTFIWPRSTDEFDSIKSTVIAAGKKEEWNVEKWINFHNDPSVSNLAYSPHSLSLTWSYSEAEYGDQRLAKGVAVNKTMLDNLIANCLDKNFNISPSRSYQAPLINGEIQLATEDGGSLPIFALEQHVLPGAVQYNGYYLFQNYIGGWNENYGEHVIDIWLKLTSEDSATEDIFLIKQLKKQG